MQLCSYLVSWKTGLYFDTIKKVQPAFYTVVSTTFTYDWYAITPCLRENNRTVCMHTCCKFSYLLPVFNKSNSPNISKKNEIIVAFFH